MVKNRKAYILRKRLSSYRRIQKEAKHNLVTNGFYSIKSGIEGNENIPAKVKADLLEMFKIIEPPFAEIMSLFDEAS